MSRGLNYTTVKASNGDELTPDSWAQTINYNGDGTVNYVQVTAPNGNVYRQTYGYTAGKVTSISQWVKQ